MKEEEKIDIGDMGGECNTRMGFGLKPVREDGERGLKEERLLLRRKVTLQKKTTSFRIIHPTCSLHICMHSGTHTSVCVLTILLHTCTPTFYLNPILKHHFPRWSLCILPSSLSILVSLSSLIVLLKDRDYLPVTEPLWIRNR